MNLHQSTEEIYNGIRVHSECETRQLASRQDHAAYGSYTDYGKTFWGVTFDGHGNHQAIQRIRGANLDEIMKRPFPWIDIQKILDEDPAGTDVKLRSGSTMVLTKIHVFDDEIRVVVTTIGDSTAVVFVNHEPVFTTTPHSLDNGEEIARLIQENRVNVSEIVVTKGQSFEVISPTKLRTTAGKYVVFRPKSTQIAGARTAIQYKSPIRNFELAMTQSLGHCGYTGIRPTTTVLKCRRTDHINVCMSSDGVTDVLPVNGLDSHNTFTFMTSTTTALLNEAERRWKQDWLAYNDTNLMSAVKNRFPKDGYDDCSCAILVVESVPEPVPASASATDMASYSVDMPAPPEEGD